MPKENNGRGLHPDAVIDGGCSDGCCDYYRCPHCGRSWSVEPDKRMPGEPKPHTPDTLRLRRGAVGRDRLPAVCDAERLTGAGWVRCSTAAHVILSTGHRVCRRCAIEADWWECVDQTPAEAAVIQRGRAVLARRAAGPS
ncbi:MAG TPA: hypothetical protein VEI97_14785 [bacterium]|nr:hypothetical protein [bacterium]